MAACGWACAAGSRDLIMLRFPLRALAIALVPLLGLALIGTSCQDHVGDCNETLTCETGGSPTGGGTGLGAAAGEGGQGGEGGHGGQGGAPGTGGSQPCDPAEEQCDSGAIVHVSPLGSDQDPGSALAPVKTIGEALTRAAMQLGAGEDSVLVYLCTTEGSYDETLSLGEEHSGIGIYGGFECGEFNPNAERAVIMAGDPSGHRIQSAETVTLGDVHLESPDAEGAGESSFGLTVVESTGVLLVRSEIVAGEGGAGEAGVGYTTRAAPGADGNEGSPACTVGASGTNAGGLAATTSCEGAATASIGGKGGPGGGGALPAAGVSGDPGEPDGGMPGVGQVGTACTANGVGDPGDPGDPGDAGAPSPQLGTIDSSGYAPPVGAAGMPGTVGKGGGGGGGVGAPGCPQDTYGGASGGGGGGGGCPGVGAGGGQAGGGSFGLFSVSSEVNLSETTVSAAVGGRGGAGGDGQLGGDPGVGGFGGPTGEGNGGPACRGGDGGQGGAGGPGGGGAGGPSFGIVYIGDAPVGPDADDIAVPSAGAAGGLGGDDNEAGDASAGQVHDTWDATL